MTPEEAIEILGDFEKQAKAKADGAYQTNVGKMACDMAISALKEIQQYREIGTVEEIKSVKKYIDLKRRCGTPTNTIDLCAEYITIGTVEECREAIEKQKEMKPKEILRHRGGFEIQHCPNCNMDYQVDKRYEITDLYCPVCGKLLDSGFNNYCANCGQAILYENENLEEAEDEL